MSGAAFLFVAAGGALGAVARFALTLVLLRHGPALPLGTLLSNLLGCLVMGFVLQWFAESDWLAGTAVANEHYRLLFAVGFCGSFTTLSALVYEMATLAGIGQAIAAAAYLLASVAGGLLCFFAGIGLARLLLPAA